VVSPFVAGTITLIKQIAPDTSTQDVKKILREGSTFPLRSSKAMIDAGYSEYDSSFKISTSSNDNSNLFNILLE